MEENSQLNIEIRRLQREDELCQCARLMASSDPWMTLRRDYEMSLLVLQDPSKELYGAFIKDEFAGFILLQMNGAFRGYIQAIAVMPAWRGQRIGSQMIAFAEERIFRETPNVFICVSSFNSNAQRFYKRLGFEMIGELKNYIVSGHSEFLLRKTIAPLAEFKAGA